MSAIASVKVAPRLSRLRDFVSRFSTLLNTANGEPAIIEHGSRLLSDLVAHDDWLPETHAAPRADRYQQYLLYCDEAARFSVVSFVWGPGQSTPIHDHRVWGLIGVLRGGERVETFVRNADGELVTSSLPALLGAGNVDAVSPTIGDIHRVANAFDNRVSISIHVYGANIGTVERASYNAFGQPRPFVSGYADVAPPDLWNGQAES